VNWLLLLIPVAVVIEHAGVAAPVIFLVAALAIVPLAALIVHSTEQVVLLAPGVAFLKGIQLIAVYLVIAASVYWLPVVAP
jgi:Ca2+/H+ antiporter